MWWENRYNEDEKVFRLSGNIGRLDALWPLRSECPSRYAGFLFGVNGFC
jgi:hypothetical protein